MKTPYQTLDVTPDTSDVEIKQAYLKKVKNNPPDRDQEQFQLIHKAYTSIKDHKSRVSYSLFTLPTANFDELIDQALNTEKIKRLTSEHFKQLLHAGVDESTFQITLGNPKKQ